MIKLPQIILLLFVTGALSACALFQDQKGPESFIGPREEVLFAKYEEVWRATNIVLQEYPLRLSNMDDGIIETDDIKGYRSWRAPFPTRKPSGMSYRITVRVVKGMSGTKPATKIIILKDAKIQRDFFSNVKQVPSNGLEEKAILYRIKREVQIERAINQVQKMKNG